MTLIQMNRLIFQLLLLFSVISLSACPQPSKYPKEKSKINPLPPNYKVRGALPPVYDAPDIIGTLGGARVHMVDYTVQDVMYADTPSPFAKEWGDYQAPPRTYDSKITSMGFYMNHNTGKIRDTRNDGDFYEEENQPASPWVLVGIESNNEIMNRPDFLDTFLNRDLEEKPELPSYHYVKISETLYGLQRYIVPGTDPKTGKPYRFENFESDDLFIARDKSGHVRSYIKCSNKDVPNPPCRHRFKLMNGIQVTIDLLYSRQRLYDWQKLEKQSADIILGFTRTAENDPVNIQSSSNRSK